MHIYFLIIISFLFISCGSSSSKNAELNFNKEEKEFLQYQFKYNYLWNNEISNKIINLNNNDYNTPKDMIKDFKYSALDKWSYSETFEHYTERSTQITSGFGCYYKGSYIRNVAFNSPCDKAGIKRGDHLILINNDYITNKKYKNFQNNMNTQVIFTIQRDINATLQNIDIPITPIEYTYKVSKYNIFKNNSNNKKIGHLIYNSFTQRSTVELDEAFDYFKENNIDELIIDLRYNGGGSLNTASYFLDKLVSNKQNQLQFYQKFNTQNQDLNKYTYFDDVNNSIDLQRIIFITTKRTASASELIINTLKPYLDVVIIGSISRGKPVGMRMAHLGDKLIYWLINFSVYNKNDIGDYYSGLNPTCIVDDEITYNRDNTDDILFNYSLQYLNNNSCPDIALTLRNNYTKNIN